MTGWEDSLRHLRPAAAAAFLVVIASGCGEESAKSSTTDIPSESSTGPSASRPPTAAQSDPPPAALAAEDYEPTLFEDSATVDHLWYPLRPGTRLFYRGSSVEDGQRLRHTVDITVTDLTKVIDGVRTVVVWERDYTEDELVETELALFAQDKEGNIWHMGEYPEEWEDGEFDKAPAWVHGLAGASAGITIAGDPRVGTPGYAQGYAPPPINWVDRGKVYKTGHQTCVPAGCYEDVVVIEEFEEGLPDAFQDKYYAPGVGVVRVGWRGSKDESKEVLRLTRLTMLTADQLAEVRAGALALEERAYRISKDVWAKTPRAEGPPG